MSMKLGDIIKCYDGIEDFSEWISKFELVARLQKLSDLDTILPLFLSKGAFLVYDGLADEEKTDYGRLRGALERAFCIDRVTAFEELCNRKLADGEPVDVYVTDIKRLVHIIDSK